MDPTLPSKALLAAQAEWLAPARARLLRRIGVARRRRLLDLGTGYGAVTGELLRRGGGIVVALDRVETAVSHIPSPALPLCSDARSLPFAQESFDLVFCQCVLMWLGERVQTAVAEIHRVLEPGGVLIALEPDYAGMIEYPPATATQDIWLTALKRAGAEPRAGRMLPGLLAAQGFQVRVDLFDQLGTADKARFDFLRTLPLVPEEISTLDRVTAAADNRNDPWEQIAHLPFFLITATKT